MNRRDALTALGRGGMCGLLAGTAVAAVSCVPTKAPAAVVDDPMIEALRKYHADLAWYDGSATDGLSDPDMDAARDASWGPFYMAVQQGDVPAVQTDAGAIEALRFALAEDAFEDPFAENLVRAALAFLEGRA